MGLNMKERKPLLREAARRYQEAGAKKGKSAILYALEKLKEFRPDIILLDSIMPRMSGLRLAKIPWANGNCRDIPPNHRALALEDARDKASQVSSLALTAAYHQAFKFSELPALLKAVLRRCAFAGELSNFGSGRNLLVKQ